MLYLILAAFALFIISLLVKTPRLSVPDQPVIVNDTDTDMAVPELDDFDFSDEIFASHLNESGPISEFAITQLLAELDEEIDNPAA